MVPPRKLARNCNAHIVALLQGRSVGRSVGDYIHTAPPPEHCNAKLDWNYKHPVTAELRRDKETEAFFSAQLNAVGWRKTKQQDNMNWSVSQSQSQSHSGCLSETRCKTIECPFEKSAAGCCGFMR